MLKITQNQNNQEVMKRLTNLIIALMLISTVSVKAQRQGDVIIEFGAGLITPTGIGSPITMTAPMGLGFVNSGGEIAPAIAPAGFIQYMASDKVKIGMMIGWPPKLKYHGHINFQGFLYKIKHEGNFLPYGLYATYLTGHDIDKFRLGFTGGLLSVLVYGNEVTIRDTSLTEEQRAIGETLEIREAYQIKKRVTLSFGFSAYYDITDRIGVYVKASYMPLPLEFIYKGHASSDFVDGLSTISQLSYKLYGKQQLIIYNDWEFDPIIFMAGISCNIGNILADRN